MTNKNQIDAKETLIETQRQHLEMMREMNEVLKQENDRLRQINSDASVGLMITNAYRNIVDWYFWFVD